MSTETEKKKYDLIISPSQIESFDHASPFGCERKWWLKSILKWPEPQSDAQGLGDQLHATIEHYLGARPEAPKSPRAQELFAAGKHIIDDVKPDVYAVEEWMQLVLDGCLVRGRIDLLLGRFGVHTILDWKTTSSIEKYAKSAHSLKTNTQLVLYANYVKQKYECGNPLTLSHVYFQTRGTTRAERISTQVTHEALDSHTQNVIVPVIRRMKQVARVEDVSQTNADTSKCRMCAFNTRCPKESILPSLRERLAAFKPTAAEVAATPAPATTVISVDPQPYCEASTIINGEIVKCADRPGHTGGHDYLRAVGRAPAVVPPDAPKSDPALAADPVEGFSPMPPPKAQTKVPVTEFKKELGIENKMVEVERGVDGQVVSMKKRGRPKKMKFEDVPADAPAVAAPIEVDKRGAPAPVFYTVKKVTLSHGLTLNMGNFNSARVDVSMEAEVGEDVSTVLDALSMQIRARLNQELEPYQQAAKLEVKKP